MTKTVDITRPPVIKVGDVVSFPQPLHWPDAVRNAARDCGFDLPVSGSMVEYRIVAQADG